MKQSVHKKVTLFHLVLMSGNFKYVPKHKSMKQNYHSEKREPFYQCFLNAKIFAMLNTIKTNSKTDNSSYSCRSEICVHFYS